MILLVAGGSAGLVALAMEHTSNETWSAILVALALGALTVVLLRRASSRESDPRIARLLWWAMGLKMASALVRYIVAFGVYDGVADAGMYHETGVEIARQILHGATATTDDPVRHIPGTGTIQMATGVLYSAIGPTRVGGFLVFSWFGFWGLYLWHRAFVRACPEGDHWRYARLVLLLPSMLFWPSSIGKEAWMCLALGIVAYGAARLFTHARGGLPIIAAGVVMLYLVRPHVAALILAAVFVAFLVRRPPVGASVLAPLGKMAVILVLGGSLAIALGRLEAFFGVDSFNPATVEYILDGVVERTDIGGSRFAEEANTANTNFRLSQFPQAFVNVMFRPFPWQAHNPLALIASAEAALLFGLFVLGWRRIVGAVRSLLRTPYVVLCCTYSVLFIYGFSAFANAGLLVRQRVQLLPFVLVLVCLPAFARRGQGWRELLTGPVESAPVARDRVPAR